MFSSLSDLNSRFSNFSSLADGISNIDISNIGATLANSLSLDSLQTNESNINNQQVPSSSNTSRDNDVTNINKDSYEEPKESSDEINKESTDAIDSNTSKELELKKIIESLNDQLQNEKNINNQLTEKNSILVNDLHQAQDAIESLSISLKDDQTPQTEDLTNKISQYEELIIERDNKIESLKDKLRKCKRIIDEKENRLESILLKLSQYEEKNHNEDLYTDISKKLLEKDNVILELENKIGDLIQDNESSYSLSVQENQKLSNDFNEINEKFNDLLNKYNKELSDKNDIIQNLKIEIQTLSSTIESFSKSKSDDYSTHEDKDIIITELKNNIRNLTSDMESKLSDQSNYFNATIDDLKSKLSFYESNFSNNDINDKLVSLINESVEKNNEINELKSNIDNNNKYYISHLNDLENQLKDKNILINELNMKLTDELEIKLNEQVNKYELEIAELKSQVSSFQSKDLNADIKEYITRINNSETEVNRLVDLNRELLLNTDNLINDINKLNEFIERLQNDLDELLSDKSKLIAEMKELNIKYSTDVDNLNGQIKLLTDEIVSIQQKNGFETNKLLDKMKSNEGNINIKVDELQSKNQTLNNEILQLQQLLDEASTNYINITNEYDSLLSKNKDQDLIILKSNDTIIELKNQCSNLDAVNNDLKTKVSTLTDKLKDIMKKFAEIKSRNSLLEKADEKLEETLQLLQSKDSEIMSLKLKYENLETMSVDSRQISQELSEKYSELQRELGRLKTTINEKNNEIEILTNDNNTCKNKIQELINELINKKLEIEKVSNDITSIKQISEFTSKDLSNKLIEQKKIYDNDITNLQIEIQSLHSKIIGENELMKSLEEYKKRAQSALKKANTNSANLTTEKEKLFSSLKDANRLIDEKEIEINNLKSTCDTEKKLIMELRDELVIIQSKVKLLEDELVNNNNKIQTITDNENKLIEDYEKQLSDLKHQLSNASKSFHENSIENELISVVTSPKNVNKGKNQSYDEDHLIDVDLQENNKKSNKPETFIYMTQLNNKIEELKSELANRGLELNVTLQELQLEREAKRKLSNKVDDLTAIIDRTRKTSNNSSGQDQSIIKSLDVKSNEFNVEYLKNCIYRYMSTNELSEKKRLIPVISTLLNLTKEEKQTIDNIIRAEEIDTDDLAAIASIGTSIESFFGNAASLFGNKSNKK